MRPLRGRLSGLHSISEAGLELLSALDLLLGVYVTVFFTEILSTTKHFINPILDFKIKR